MNRWYSDVDLNFVYSEEYKTDIFPIEELICLLITDIFKLGYRDHIHNMMIYSVNEEITQKFKTYKIKFNFGEEIEYTVRSTKTHLIYKIYKSKRDIGSFSDYIDRCFKAGVINEWCYSLLSIDGFDDYDISNILFKIKLNSGRKKKFYVNKIREEIKKINSDNFLYFSYSNFSVKSLNIKYKKYYLEIIQKFLIIFNEFYNISRLTNFVGIYRYLEVKVKNSICKYLWLLMRVEKVLNDNKIDYSYKSQCKITYKEFNNLYFGDFSKIKVTL